MAWSDRGGASRHLGDRWSELCTEALDGWRGTSRPVPSAEPFMLEAVVRLDEDARIAIQAGTHKLTNPDFVLYGRRADGEAVFQAADAKFAVDTIKPVQVSVDALTALLEIEGGLVGEAIEREVGHAVPADATIVRGVFLSPISPLTDYYLPRVTSDPRLAVEPQEVVLLSAEPGRMFAGLPVSTSIGHLARVDRLPQTPRENLLAAIYYFRLASACAWMWVEERTPLLTTAGPPQVDPGSLETEVIERVRGSESAFSVAEEWYADVERVGHARQSVAEVATVPVSMREIRQQVEARTGEENRRLVRRVRGALDRIYRERLVAEVGEVPAKPAEPMPDVLERIARASRSLRDEMRRTTLRLIEELRIEETAKS
jgi:hypothetical protein